MLWASFMDRHQKASDTYKTEEGAIMNEGTRNQLELRLKKMLDHLDQAEAKKKPSIPQAVTGNIIRRRRGEKDKRFSICL
jgi:hypothetical protein